MKEELTLFLGRDHYQHQAENKNHRNGSYERSYTLKGIGKVDVKVPRDRKGAFKTKVIPKSQQVEEALVEDLSLMFLTGISTRSLSLISKRLLGRSLSPAKISSANQELTQAVEQWRERDLSDYRLKYLFMDGTCFKMRVAGTITTVPVLVVVGVTETGHKMVLGMQSGDKESASTWRQFFKDLKRRGLNASSIQLGIMDGLPGLEKVFKEEFTQAKIQRCQVHVARNVLCKVPKKEKQAVADDLRSIFYASSKQKAWKFYYEFAKKWEKELPSAFKSLSNSIGSCLTFFDYPEEEWLSLRTTNAIERLNKEFKRRTKSMEIVAGENACYRLMAFIALKMEVHWRSTPVGKVRKNLPFFSTLEF
jgi:transposase-like protein